jgi:hypothetical protein
MSIKPSYPSAVNTANPLCPDAVFFLNEGSGTTIHECRHGGTGTLSGGATWGTGDYSAPCITLDGTGIGTYASDGNVSLGGGQAGTVVVGFRVSSGWSGSGDESLVTKSAEYLFYHSYDSFVRWYWSNQTGTGSDTVWQIPSEDPSSGSPHILIGQSANNAASNIALDGTSAGGQIAPATRGYATTNPLIIGSAFVGNIDFVYVYHRALSGSEIASLQSNPFVFATSKPTMAVSPTTAATGGGNVSFTITGTATSWTGGTTVSLTGGTGASIVSQSISGQVITAVVNVGTAAGPLTFGDTTDAATATATVTLGLPGSPTVLPGAPGNSQAVLTWTAPVSGGSVASYSVFRGTLAGGESTTALATGITGTSYTDSTAVNGTSYYYTIKAVNSTGSSLASSEAGPYTPSSGTLTLTESAPAVADGGTVSLTGTLSTGTGTLTAVVSGGGTLSTGSPTIGTPFTYIAPATGTGAATVTLSSGSATPVAKTIFYGPTSDWAEVYLPGSTTNPVTCQVYDTGGNAVGPIYGPLSSLPGSGTHEFGLWIVLPAATTIYRAVFSDGNGGTGVYVSRPGSTAVAVDPWSVSLPGAYAPGSAGAILGQNLDAKVSTRSTYAGGAVASVTSPVTVGTNNDKTGYGLAQAFPANFASLAIASGAVTVGAYAQGQDPASLVLSTPANKLSTDGSGRVTAGTVADKAGYTLAPNGLDAIAVENGINARQALSPILAACAGVVTGAASGTIVIRGANVANTRITATTDYAGDRSAVTLSLPA